MTILSKMYISEAYNSYPVEPGRNHSRLMYEKGDLRREKSLLSGSRFGYG
jgi:hypothetical protein